MHTYQQATATELLLVALVNVVARNLVYLVDHQLPAAKIKIPHTEVHTLHTHIGDDIL